MMINFCNRISIKMILEQFRLQR